MTIDQLEKMYPKVNRLFRDWRPIAALPGHHVKYVPPPVPCPAVPTNPSFAVHLLDAPKMLTRAQGFGSTHEEALENAVRALDGFFTVEGFPKDLYDLWYIVTQEGRVMVEIDSDEFCKWFWIHRFFARPWRWVRPPLLEYHI